MPQKKRQYTQRNKEYWTNLSKRKAGDMTYKDSSFLPSGFSEASCPEREVTRTRIRNNKVSTESISNIHSSLDSFALPFEKDGSYLDISDAIKLCQKTYANISIFRNTIDIMTEFSAAKIYLTEGNAASRTFVEAWLKRINAWKLTEMFFREYYRSGNVFLYKFIAKFTDDDIKKMKSFAGEKPEIPVRYTILNPIDIVAKESFNFDDLTYFRVLSEYEIKKLRTRDTEEDKLVFEGLPREVQKDIDNKMHNKSIFIPIKPERLYAVFYKKQPYEPFAIPFGFPVLKDLNFKEELKKVDQEVSRTVNQSLLLVTQGVPKDQHGNNVNQKAIDELTKLFQNRSVSRTIVSDFSTKAEFVIPQIDRILDPKKYEVINNDIKDGLLNIISGDEKFANATVKTKIFLERLNGGRDMYLSDFLQPEINAICKQMGFKSVPRANFQDIDMRDENLAAKIYTRLMEIGVLTPGQGFKAMQTGILPDAEELGDAQNKYVEERKEGHFNPLVAGVPMYANPVKNNQSGQQAAPRASNPNSPMNGRPQEVSTASLHSFKEIKKHFDKSNKIISKLEKSLASKYNLEKLDDKQKDAAFRLATKIMSETTPDSWEKQLEIALEDPIDYLNRTIDEKQKAKVLEISKKYEIDIYSASLLLHSEKEV